MRYKIIEQAADKEEEKASKPKTFDLDDYIFSDYSYQAYDIQPISDK